MKDYKKIIFASIIVALASQISIGLMVNSFRASAGIISFVLLLLYYEELKPIPLGIVSGIMVYLLRLMVYYLTNGKINDIITSYLLEILFYIFYSIIYFLLKKKTKGDNEKFIFFIMVISDFFANFIEIFVRSYIENTIFPWDLVFTLILVSILRSTIVWFILNIFKYYKMFLLKEEHENRYKKLLWLTSELKTEMYWIEKNMDNIEHVMANSYELFEKINLNKESETWANQALSIASDVHEIKKENCLVIRGMREITESELKDKGMDFKDIMNILCETMKKEARRIHKNIEIIFYIKENFYTSKHYYLMSILRNLVRNSMDAIDSSKLGAKITVNHKSDKEYHYFIVSDNGSGIDKEKLNHIFSPGFSTKINYNTGEINRGLGLSIVQYISEEQLKGIVKVNSVIGEGTTFHISIPKRILEEK